MAEANTDDNSKLVDMDDLNKFEDAFFEREPRKVEVEVEDAVEEDEEIAENEDDGLATEAEDEDENHEEKEEDEDPKPEPKVKKKQSAQERINEVIAQARAAERERDALAQRLAEVERTRTEVKQEEKAPVVQNAPEAPKPDAVNDKGEPLYPLGEFDPRYITDLTRFTIEDETKKMQAKLAEEAKAREVEAEQAAIRDKYVERVEKIKEEIPDYQEQVTGLVQSFSTLEPQYGNYLANTIMQCDNGPEIMLYLSQNIGEAQKIVASGPFAATLAIGRLQAQLERPVEAEEKRNTQKVSAAPPPPEARVRGKGGQFATRPDTDDLDAFEKEFFKR